MIKAVPLAQGTIEDFLRTRVRIKMGHIIEQGRELLERNLNRELVSGVHLRAPVWAGRVLGVRAAPTRSWPGRWPPGRESWSWTSSRRGLGLGSGSAPARPSARRPRCASTPGGHNSRDERMSRVRFPVSQTPRGIIPRALVHIELLRPPADLPCCARGQASLTLRVRIGLKGPISTSRPCRHPGRPTPVSLPSSPPPRTPW
jgi:hypothetical protein